jgi:hypothetical protein
MSKECDAVHKLANNAKRFQFPFNDMELPKNGIYILFEKGEKAHGGDRIVRVGTHTGKDQLISRLKQHFMMENKDRSIFRKNIGRCLLSDDPYLAVWEKDLTTQASKQKYSHTVDKEKQLLTEKQITKYLQTNFSFIVILEDNSEERLQLESKIIATVAQCTDCRPSPTWFGKCSSKEKIRTGKLWLVNEINKEKLNEKEITRMLIRAGQHLA